MSVVSRALLLFVLLIILILILPSALQRILPLSFSDLIVYYGNKTAIDPALIAAVIYVESSFRPGVISNKGAIGLMQLMPETAYWLAEQRDLSLTQQELLQPPINVELGSFYLRHLLDRFPSEHAALAAYNGGPTNVRRWLEEDLWDGTWENAGQIPFYETRAYVRRVSILRRLYRFFYDRELQVGRGSR